jgi:hypothetical protein
LWSVSRPRSPRPLDAFPARLAKCRLCQNIYPVFD